MRKPPRPFLEASLGALAREVGVTRVARLTGLDRTGVEVASAIRPAGHVLQVTNGKGDTFLEAVQGALGEAAELWAAERVAAWPFGSAAELGGHGVRVLADGVGAGRVAWCRARDGALVPAAEVFCPPEGAPLLGPIEGSWTSNGMGAHPTREGAVLHALLELIERDRLARTLPEGFTSSEIARRLLDPSTLAAAAPRTAELARRMGERGFGVYLLDAGSPISRPDDLDLHLPVAAALLVDRAGGPVPVAAGYACRLSRDEALRAALLEAAQSRATEIHGAREDVLAGDRHAAAALVHLLAQARPRRSASALPSARAARPAAAVRTILGGLGEAGIEPAIVELAAPPGLHVVKVIAPGLLLSELLR